MRCGLHSCTSKKIGAGVFGVAYVVGAEFDWLAHTRQLAVAQYVRTTSQGSISPS